MNTLRLGQLLVFLQFLLIFLLAWNPLFVEALLTFKPGVWLPLLAGAAVGLAALWANRPGNFNIHPHPHPKGALVRHGPYRWVRHPMYSAVLLFGLACVVAAPSAETFGYLVSLMLVLLGKARIEERLLLAKHPDYAGYAAATKRLLPGLF
jgi:protein-S-isoprenylcysteine O-methyltransferase Ste14